MINYILGYVEICVNDINVINLLVKNNISCYEIKKYDNLLHINIPLYSLNKFKNILNKDSIGFEIINIKGIPGFFVKFKARYGLLFGVLLFLIAISFSGRYIWAFRISGNNKVNDQEIIDVLEELGCGIGAKINDIDFDKLHNKFLMECPDISWISVNMDGVIANVEIKEVRRGKKSVDGYTNVIAAEDGQIELITTVSGKPQVEIGDVVRKGDLLISGVESYRDGENIYFTGADGIVMARVKRNVKIAVDKHKKTSVKTGDYKERNTLKIFNLNINLFGKCGNPYNKYDIITKNKQLVLFDNIVMPIWLNKEIVYEVFDNVIVLSNQELEAEASRTYNDLLRDSLKDSELVSISTNREYINGILTIESNLYCTTDIAERVSYDFVSYDQKED